LERLAVIVAEVARLSDEDVAASLVDRRLATSAPASETGPAYRVLGGERGVAHAGTEVRLTRPGRWARLAVETVELAARCPDFASLEAHARRLARRSGADPSAIGRRLAEAVAAGVLVGRGDLAERCRRALAAEPPSSDAGPPITVVGIPTCDR